MASGGYRITEGVELINGGAAHFTDENIIVVADMHLGVEAALEYEGMSLPRVQSRKIERYMVDLVERIGPDRIVVAGDLKHNFSRNLVQEWKDVSRFVELLASRTPLEVVKGNHDNYLAIILREHGLPLKRDAKIGRFRVLHGHESRTLIGPTVLGHIHPSIRLKDRVGAGIKDPCFLWNERRQVLVLPALSIVSSGADVVGQRSADSISPLLADEGLDAFVPVVSSGSGWLRFPTVGEMRKTL